jgi:DnaA family protein
LAPSQSAGKKAGTSSEAYRAPDLHAPRTLPMRPLSEQLLLDLGPLAEPSLSNFVAGRNREVLATLRSYRQLSAKERYIHLWGAPGSGRSHLLRAMAIAEDGRLLFPGAEPKQWEFSEPVGLYAVDDVDQLDGAEEAALFGLINEARAHPGYAVLTTASQPPLALSIREDLRTRLGWGLVYKLEVLDDVDTDSALCAHAKQLGLSLNADVRRYLLTRCERNLRFLTHLIDRLDRYALVSHRPVTLPLLRAFLLDEEGTDGA